MSNDTPLVYISVAQLEEIIRAAVADGVAKATASQAAATAATFVTLHTDEVCRLLGISAYTFRNRYNCGVYAKDIIRLRNGLYRVNQSLL